MRSVQIPLCEACERPILDEPALILEGVLYVQQPAGQSVVCSDGAYHAACLIARMPVTQPPPRMRGPAPILPPTAPLVPHVARTTELAPNLGVGRPATAADVGATVRGPDIPEGEILRIQEDTGDAVVNTSDAVRVVPLSALTVLRAAPAGTEP